MKNEFEIFIRNPHLFGQYLGYKDLIPLHSEWINDAWINKSVKSMQAHRNSYKTTAILIVGAIWWLLFHNPNETILFIRKAETDAQKILSAIKTHLEGSKVLAIAEEIYGVKQLKTDVWSNKSIKLSIKTDTTPEGNIEAKGSTAAITGSHYGKIFPDDIITLKDRVSKAEREWIKDFVRELRNIKKEDGELFFSGTPWHKDDAWTIVPEPKVYPLGLVPIKGFMPDEIEAKKAELREGTTISLYTANYELKHISDGMSLFPEPVYGNWLDGIGTIAYLDPSYMGDNTTALSIGGRSEDTAYCRGYVWNENIIDLYDVIVDKLKRYNCGTLYIETNADKGLSMKDISEKWSAVRGIHEKENKHIRIVDFAVRHFKNIIWANDTDDTYMNQIIDYQEGQDPDDAADSLAGLMRQLGFAGQQYLVIER